MYKNPRATAKALALSGLADRLEQAYEDEIAAVEKAKQLAEMEKQRRAAAIRHAQEAADAREPFTTPNYGVHTTSEEEWLFVLEAAEGLTRLGRDAYAEESESMLEEAGGEVADEGGA